MKESFGLRVRKAARSLPGSFRPETALVLGSGLSGIVEGLGYEEIPFARIAEFPRPTVQGHRGSLFFSGKNVIMAGRFHYYEGHSMDDVVLPVFMLGELGVKTLILTNAAGGINESFRPGDLVLIKDHINLMGTNPFIGENPKSEGGRDFGPRFFDMSSVYDASLREAARRKSPRPMPEGVYCALTGPSYETPAEIRMLRAMGADLVGMSTVPEATAASYLGMKVLGISCVTNMAAGISKAPLNHAEVVEAGKKVEAELKRLVLALLEELSAT